MEKSALPEKDSSCSMGNDNTGILVVVPSVLSPEPPTPDSPHASLIHFALTLPEPMVHGCKWNFVCWLFKRLSASLVTSLWQTETPLHFTAICYLGFFPSFGAIGWGAQVLVYTLLFSRGIPPSHGNILPGFQQPPIGAQLAFSNLLHTLYQSLCGDVASSICHWL